MKTNTRLGLHSARNKALRFCMGTSVLCIITISILTVFPYYQEYERAMAEGAPNAVSSELNLNVTNNEANLLFSATGGEYGSFASSGDAITFVASTNNSSGYTIEYVGSDDVGSLTHADGVFQFLSISSPLTMNEFSAPANTSYNNKWGFKPSKYVSDGIVIDNTGDSGVFLPIPTTAGVVIDKTTQPKNNESYTVEIGARADLSIDAGEYVGNYDLVIIANPVSYEIAYNAGNTTDVVTSLPETQNSSTSDTSITLSNSVPARAHHSFIGWCDVLPTTTDGTDTCTGINAQTGNPAIQYAAGEEYGINQTTSNNATLYAMWQIDTFTCAKQYRLENVDGTWGDYVTDGTETINYGGTCEYSKAVTNYKNSANGVNGSTASTSVSNVMADTTLSLDLYRNTFTCSKRYRLQNVDGTFPSAYTTDGSVTTRYGGSCNYTKTITNYKNASNGTNGSQASTSASNVASDQTLSLDFYRNTFTCTRQYRLQNADGSFPSSYTGDGSITALYGSSCSYAKTITDYKSSSGANGSQVSTSASNIASNQTLSLDFYRNTYTLTVTAGSNTSSASGGGAKRWGQASTVSVTKATNVTCTSYATPTWTQSGTAGTFSSTSGASVTFTMGKGNTTVTATSAASAVAQTVTLSRSGGASGIKINNTNYTASSVSLTCGTYNISGTYDSNYEFSSWSRANGVTVASTSSASTTMTVSGAGTLTLAGKASCNSLSGYMQDIGATSSYCANATGTMVDKRDNQSYTVAKIGNTIWMTKNLNLAGGTKLYSDTSDVPDGYPSSGGTPYRTLQASKNRKFGVLDSSVSSAIYTYDHVYNSGSTDCSSSYGCYSYYTLPTAILANSSMSATGSICPKGWRLPTKSEGEALIALYSTGNSLAAAPFNAVYSGSFYDYHITPTASVGLLGDLWTSTTSSGSSRYAIHFIKGTSSASMQPNDPLSGNAVRCVAK